MSSVQEIETVLPKLSRAEIEEVRLRHHPRTGARQNLRRMSARKSGENLALPFVT